MNNLLTQNKHHAPGKLMILAILFASGLLLSNIMAVKVFSIGGLEGPTGLLIYPITFVIMDTVVEVWGKSTARKLIVGGLVANLMAAIVLTLSTHIPTAPFLDLHEAYSTILGGVPRIAVASMVAYYVSQSLDVALFSKLKNKFKGKHLWIRNNVSTMTSQLVDAVLFIVIAFSFTMPIQAILTMIAVQYGMKLILAAMDTPFVYMAVAWARKEEK